MLGKAADRGFCARTCPPEARTARAPLAPSRPAPLKITATMGRPQRAADSNSTSAEGRNPAPILPGVPVAHLVIPRLGVDEIVLEGVDADVLNAGPGHLPGSAFPGERGNADRLSPQSSVRRQAYVYLESPSNPHGYVLDVPGGHGKVPIGPAYLGDDPDTITVEDAFGGRHRYPPD